MVKVSFFVKNPGNYMTLFWTSFAGLSFALSGPAQEFVSSCVFVFSQHPYDVDDWVNIMSGKDDTLLKLRVTDIRLMSSTFRRDKLAKLVSIPHNKLSKERIENLSRWDTMYDIMEPIPLESETVTKKPQKKLGRSYRALLSAKMGRDTLWIWMRVLWTIFTRSTSPQPRSL
jgi:hypothetical protein